MVKIKFKRVFPNPQNIQKFTGIKTKIKRLKMTKDEIEIEFEKEPTTQELNSIQTFLSKKLFEGVKIE